MKVLRKWTFILMALLLAFSLAAFVGCGGGDNSGDNGNDGDGGNQGEEEDITPGEGETTYKFEAEYTLITDDMVGFGPSGSPYGLNLIGESSSASNGFFVSSLGPQSPITFTITSSAEVTVTLRARLGSNALGTCTWSPTEFQVTVNDTAVNYSSFTTQMGTTDTQNFTTYNLGDITLEAGENTIVFKAGENHYLNNASSAPSIDYIMIVSSATLTMETYEDNIL